jgi:tetratricopeptide (TPR) repeat protein
VRLPGGGLPTGWLLVPALLGAAFLTFRCGRAAAPEVLLLLLPMAVVLLFWFSPRYRLPVAVPAALLAPYGLAALALLRPRALGLGLAGLAVAAPLGAEAALRARGFDHPDLYQAEYEMHVGEALMNLKRPAEAYDRFANSVQLGLEQAITHEYMGDMQRDLGRLAAAEAGAAPGGPPPGLEHYQRAIVHWSRAIELNPERFFAYVGRGTTLVFLGQREAGLRDALQALTLARRENHPQAVPALEDFLRRNGVEPPPR